MGDHFFHDFFFAYWTTKSCQKGLYSKRKVFISLRQHLCGGSGTQLYPYLTCTAKGVKIYSTNQWNTITSFDNFIGWLEVLKLYDHKTEWHFVCVCVCVYSDSRNDIPQVPQRYGAIAAQTRHRASVLVVFVVFCVHMYNFASLIRQTPSPTFSDTAITDPYSDITIFKLRAHWVRISWSIGSEKPFGHVPPVGVEPSTSCVQGEHPIHYARKGCSPMWS